MSEPPISTQISSQRLISLDALRGFTIAGMVIVNDPGTWEHVYAPLEHSKWNGLTFTDLIFPFFLFIVGVSVALAYTKRIKQDIPKKDLYKKIISRTVKIFVLGLFLWLWPEFHFSAIRWAGVLQRIAIVFLACTLLFLKTDWKKQLWIGVSLLIGYWLIMSLIPVPIDDVIHKALETGSVARQDGFIAVHGLKRISDHFIAPNYQPAVNLAAWLDRRLIPGTFWEVTWDPEGILSTFPAIGTGIIGMLIGQLVIKEQDLIKRITYIFFIGFTMLAAGEVWQWFFPLNKNLWTSSFVLYTAGLASMGLAASMLIIDVWGYAKWTKLGRVYGANAITSYVLAGMLTLVFYGNIFGTESLNNLFVNGAINIGIAPRLASFMYAVIYMLIIYIPAYLLYRRKIFIKL